MCIWKRNDDLNINIEIISETTRFVMRFTVTIPSFYSIKKLKKKIIDYVKTRYKYEVYV